VSDVRVIFNPNRVVLPPSDGAPKAVGRAGTEARHQLGEYLDAVLPRPLYFDDQKNHARVESALDTMTRAERVYLEIEMQSRSRVLHSFDYDPLR
jgi:hypothetical protein